jgi:UvrD-like helicase C-terminal domain
LGFAITIHKAQGQTLPAVILSLSDNCQLSYASLYVALSRVKHCNDIRLLIHGSWQGNIEDWETIAYIPSLQPGKDINAFFAGFKINSQQWNVDDALTEWTQSQASKKQTHVPTAGKSWQSKRKFSAWQEEPSS